MNNVDYVVICANEGVNKCNLPDPGLNLVVNAYGIKSGISF